ncbi:MAG: amidohydrolase family protein [Proteobacteria bacterium]|nr:amidohydrolase family protein [Pseudomonadota bacterium]
MTILIRNARVLTLDDQDREHDRADILIEGDRIAAIGPGPLVVPGPDVRVIEAAGLLAMPGLVNGHFHSQGNLMAGAMANRPLELFMLFEVPPLGAAPPDPRLVYLQTQLGAIEMLKSGITAVHDDAFHNPYPTRDAISALMQAYQDAGLRATVSINHQNRIEHEKYPFLAELLPPDIRAEMDRAPVATASELADLYRWFHATWHGKADGRLSIAVSNSAPQRISEDYFGFLSEFSRRHDLPFDIHILETKLQRVLGVETYGKSLVRHVHDLGFLDERVMVIHAIWVDDADIDLLAASGCVVAHNPVCNLKLGSGVMPFRRLRERGIPIALGTDERASDDSTNMWAVGKLAALLPRVADPDYERWPEAGEILACLTGGGARGMRQPRIGSLATGQAADLILLDLDSLAFTPLNDLRRQLVFSETGSSVVMTMVAGRVVVERGKVLSVDEAALRAEIRDRMPAVRRELAATAAAAARLEPYYREMYRRAVARDVGFSRWLAP